MDETTFVARIFEIDGKEFLVTFSRPEMTSHGDFECRYVIGWPGREVRRRIVGIDSVQALLLAMRNVYSELTNSQAYKDGRLTFLEEADLGLPLPGTGI